MPSPAELKTRFTYHPPKDGESVHNEAHLLAEHIVASSPECREQSLALTALEEAVFWTNAAIARHA